MVVFSVAWGSGTRRLYGLRPSAPRRGVLWLSARFRLLSLLVADTDPTSPTGPTGPTFQKLSVFYPMWNEEDYIERALAFGKRACEGLVQIVKYIL